MLSSGDIQGPNVVDSIDRTPTVCSWSESPSFLPILFYLLCQQRKKAKQRTSITSVPLLENQTAGESFTPVLSFSLIRNIERKGCDASDQTSATRFSLTESKAENRRASLLSSDAGNRWTTLWESHPGEVQQREMNTHIVVPLCLWSRKMIDVTESVSFHPLFLTVCRSSFFPCFKTQSERKWATTSLYDHRFWPKRRTVSSLFFSLWDPLSILLINFFFFLSTFYSRLVVMMSGTFCCFTVLYVFENILDDESRGPGNEVDEKGEKVDEDPLL